MLDFLKSRRALLLTTLLLFEAGFCFACPKQEIVLLPKPLRELPARLGSWSMVSDIQIEPEVQELLRADDTLNRIYVNSKTGGSEGLFIAFFKTQKNGGRPTLVEGLPARFRLAADPVRLRPAPDTMPLRAHHGHSVISKGDDRSVVLYWYQTHNNVIADEYRAKLNTVFDSVRYHRSDTSIIRIVVPERPGGDADSGARSIALSSFETIRTLLPQ